MRAVPYLIVLGLIVMVMLFALAGVAPEYQPSHFPSVHRSASLDEEPGIWVGTVSQSEGLVLMPFFRDAHVDGGMLSCNLGACGVYVPYSQRYEARNTLMKYASLKDRWAHFASDLDLLLEKPTKGVTFGRRLIDCFVSSVQNDSPHELAPVPHYQEWERPFPRVRSTSLYDAVWETSGRPPSDYF